MVSLREMILYDPFVYRKYYIREWSLFIARVRNYWVSRFPRHPKMVLETQNLRKWYEHRHFVYHWKALILISMLSSLFACKIKGPIERCCFKVIFIAI